MNVLFTHTCPKCHRKRRLDINALGEDVRCVQCGGYSVASDGDNESLAMMDSIKYHAQLATLSDEQTQRTRVPR